MHLLRLDHLHIVPSRQSLVRWRWLLPRRIRLEWGRLLPWRRLWLCRRVVWDRDPQWTGLDDVRTCSSWCTVWRCCCASGDGRAAACLCSPGTGCPCRIHSGGSTCCRIHRSSGCTRLRRASAACHLLQLLSSGRPALHNRRINRNFDEGLWHRGRNFRFSAIGSELSNKTCAFI